MTNDQSPMTIDQRNPKPKCPKALSLRSLVWSFGFGHSLGFCHLSLGFENPWFMARPPERVASIRQESSGPLSEGVCFRKSLCRGDPVLHETDCARAIRRFRGPAGPEICPAPVRA